MANHPVFVARNVKDYLRLEEARLKSGDRPALLPASLLRKAWNPLRWTFGELPRQPAS